MVLPQRCKRCGRIQNVIWKVSDELWKKVCEESGWNPNKTLCLECFAELAGYIDLTLLTDILDNVVFRKKLWNY